MKLVLALCYFVKKQTKKITVILLLFQTQIGSCIFNFYLKKGDISCQVVGNDIKLFDFPNKIAYLNMLEISLI